MAIATLNDLIAAHRQKISFQKSSSTAKAANTFQSLWKIAGIPTAGSTPPTGVGEAPTSATVGAMPLVEIGGDAIIYSGRLAAQIATAGTLIIYDRLVHTSGLSGTVTTEQAVNTAALTRETSGAGVEVFIETYTTTGASAANLTVNYTDDEGNTQSTVIANQVTPAAGQMQQVTPIFGCRSVQSVQLSGSTGTAGDFGVTLAKRICEIPLEAGVGKVLGPFTLGLQKIANSPCLALMILASTTSTGLMNGCSLDILQG